MKLTGNILEFTCWEKDNPVEIQLEPEAEIYTVYPGSTIKFKPTDSTNEFSWALRIDHENKSVQLFPEPSHAYAFIEVYVNNTLI